LDYIGDESPWNAQLVSDAITEIIDSLPDHPERYPPDKFKKNNPGNYRAFEKYSYRVAYKHTEEEILILRIRHVKQEPKAY
jgi:plasmid stabilization system protein ParE